MTIQHPQTFLCSDVQSGLNIYNYANKDKVNGPAVGSSGSGGSRCAFLLWQSATGRHSSHMSVAVWLP